MLRRKLKRLKKRLLEAETRVKPVSSLACVTNAARNAKAVAMHAEELVADAKVAREATKDGKFLFP